MTPQTADEELVNIVTFMREKPLLLTLDHIEAAAAAITRLTEEVKEQNAKLLDFQRGIDRRDEAMEALRQQLLDLQAQHVITHDEWYDLSNKYDGAAQKAVELQQQLLEALAAGEVKDELIAHVGWCQECADMSISDCSEGSAIQDRITTPFPTLLSEHDAEVRRKVLEEAAKECELPKPECCGRFERDDNLSNPVCCGQYEVGEYKDGLECAASIRRMAAEVKGTTT